MPGPADACVAWAQESTARRGVSAVLTACGCGCQLTGARCARVRPTSRDAAPRATLHGCVPRLSRRHMPAPAGVMPIRMLSASLSGMLSMS
ncbi:hypothetical protein PsYK624_110910 [Phanerochaete sordida]|uniref:Uncharacterized protein n=1 Tax=Phanerochaete sordida TaxID=48140 RepID=A0A9P3LH26_9APHY|nr:hypothetical protein PsYK624_110910 [Phanerochaete sordida]